MEEKPVEEMDDEELDAFMERLSLASSNLFETDSVASDIGGEEVRIMKEHLAETSSILAYLQ